MIHFKQNGNKILLFWMFGIFLNQNTVAQRNEAKKMFNKSIDFLENKNNDSSWFYLFKSYNLGIGLEEIISNDCFFLKIVEGDNLYKKLLFEIFILENPDLVLPELGFELLISYSRDQKNRTLCDFQDVKKCEVIPGLIFHNKTIDRKSMIKLIDSLGWLSYSEVGVHGGDAQFLLLQHGVYKKQDLKYVKMLIEKACDNEANVVNAAKMIDRYLIQTKGYQIYGTQCKIQNNQCIVFKILDNKTINERRNILGLENLNYHYSNYSLNKSLMLTYEQTKKRIKRRHYKEGFLQIIQE